ncbi:MAG: hypothetical protein VKL39_24170 [Leptolyngbyaceae bacterium]|nr:hypothetical protein [Leptolyngbyaceae bacterium]
MMRPIRYLHALHAELVVMCKGKPKKSEAQVAAEMAAMGRVRKKVRDRNGRMVWRWVKQEEVEEPEAKEAKTAPAEVPQVKLANDRVGLLDGLSSLSLRRPNTNQAAFDKSIRYGINALIGDMDLEAARTVRHAMGERFEAALAAMPQGMLRAVSRQWSGQRVPSTMSHAEVLAQAGAAVRQPPMKPISQLRPHHGDDLEVLLQIVHAHRRKPAGVDSVKFEREMNNAASALFGSLTLEHARRAHAVMGPNFLEALNTVLWEGDLRELSRAWDPHREVTRGTSGRQLARNLRALILGETQPVPAPAPQEKRSGRRRRSG